MTGFGLNDLLKNHPCGINYKLEKTVSSAQCFHGWVLHLLTVWEVSRRWELIRRYTHCGSQTGWISLESTVPASISIPVKRPSVRTMATHARSRPSAVPLLSSEVEATVSHDVSTQASSVSQAQNGGDQMWTQIRNKSPCTGDSLGRTPDAAQLPTCFLLAYLC